MTDRRTFCASLAAGALLPLSHGARAQESRRQFSMVVPYTPGGSTDLLGRLCTEALSGQVGEKIIVENRPGANGLLGSSYVASAPPDGRTLLYAYGNLLLNQEFMMKDARFRTLESLVPVTRTCIIQAVIVTAANFPANDLREFIASAKRSPGKHTYAYYGDLGIASMAAEANVDLLRVPYKGGMPGMLDVAAGNVDIITSSLTQALPMLRSGKLKALAVFGDQRLGEWPRVPMVQEILPGFRALDYQVVLAPKNTPKAVVDQLSQRLNTALSTPEMKRTFLERGAIVAPMRPEEVQAFMEADRIGIAKVIKAAGIQPE